MEPLPVAITAAKKAGKILQKSWKKLHTLPIKSKSPFDYVTQADQDSEQVIIETIRRAFPTHRIVAEESGTSGEPDDYSWYIDPLDGTTNYIHRFPFFATSIALAHNGEMVLGVIYDPVRDELFHAEKNKGAFLNNRRILVSSYVDLSPCLLATGFPFRNKEELDLYLQVFSLIFLEVSGMRRAGSAALDLAYVACGRFDGFWELKLSPWDIAAGVLLVQEAGGKVTDFQGQHDYLRTGNIIATNSHIHKPLLSIIKKVFPKNP